MLKRVRFGVFAVLLTLSACAKPIKYTTLIPLDVTADSAESFLRSRMFTKDSLMKNTFNGIVDEQKAGIELYPDSAGGVRAFSVQWNRLDSSSMIQRYEKLYTSLVDELGAPDSTGMNRMREPPNQSNVWLEHQRGFRTTIYMARNSKLQMGFVVLHVGKRKL